MLILAVVVVNSSFIVRIALRELNLTLARCKLELMRGERAVKSGGEEDAVGRRWEENAAKHKVSQRVTIILQPNEIRTNQMRNCEWSGSNR